jgi:hypothetical protein
MERQPNGKTPDEVRRPLDTEWQRKWIGLERTSDHVARYASALAALGKKFLEGDKSKCVLVVTGPSGVGKTAGARRLFQWVQAACMSAWEKGSYPDVPGAAFYQWPEVADGFKGGQFGVLEDLFSIEFAVLDDVGAEYDTANRLCADKLCQVLSRRERKHTLVTTNLVPDQWASRLDVRIADRLFRNSVIMDMAGAESYAFQQEAADA